MALFAQQVLVFQQTKNLTRNDFAIYDAAGQQVAHVETGGSTLGRLVAGSRHLTVFDGPGNPVIQVQDTMTPFRERMEILDGAGHPLASLLKRFSLFSTRITLTMQGEELTLSGNIWGFNFEVAGAHGVYATVSREWSGLGNAFLGKSTYVLNLAEGLTVPQRQAVIGGMIALDLIREKQQNN
ncbi:LURP-one-related family protein [Zhihengliuella somnathii]